MTDAGSSFLAGGKFPVDRRYALAATAFSGATLPAARDGDTLRYKAAATATGAIADAYWNLTYDAASAQWYVVGAPLVAETDASQTTASATYVDLATIGPKITVPFLGVYLVTYGCEISNNTAGVTSAMSVDTGSGASDADWALIQSSAASFASVSRARLKTAISASTAVTAKYRVSGGTGTFVNRFLNIQPMAVK